MSARKPNARFSTSRKNGSQQALRLLALSSLGGAAALLCGGALAQDASYTYGGISVGHSYGKVNEEGLLIKSVANNVPPLSFTSYGRKDEDTAYRIFLGYQFNRNIGLEASFFNLGKYQFAGTTSPNGYVSGEVKIQGAGLDLVGSLPLSENWSVLGRVGGQYAKTRDTFSGTGAVNITNPSPSDRSFNYKAGAGLQYAFSPNLLVRGEAEQYRTRDALGGNIRVQVVSLSLVMPFGDGARNNRSAMMPAVYKPVAYVAPPAPAPAPAPMVMAPAPAPMVAAAPMAPPAPVAMPASRRVSFTADALFGFDKSTIRPEGKTALDTFAREVSGTQFEVVVVEGHADRTGSTAYNQTLSMQRAEAVKAYLVSSGGFDAAKVTAKGLGEGSPTTKPDDCKASLPTAQLRACLQPDRRVDIDVTGTK